MQLVYISLVAVSVCVLVYLYSAFSCYNLHQAVLRSIVFVGWFVNIRPPAAMAVWRVIDITVALQVPGGRLSPTSALSAFIIGIVYIYDYTVQSQIVQNVAII